MTHLRHLIILSVSRIASEGPSDCSANAIQLLNCFWLSLSSYETEHASTEGFGYKSKSNFVGQKSGLGCFDYRKVNAPFLC